MCVVTYIPGEHQVFITHNRDEKSNRSKAISPAEYNIHGYTLLFPRDSAAGGTWVALNKNGGAAVLLNGAFKKHRHQPPYRKSRGLAFLDIIAASDLYLSYCNTDLSGIEPFTVILLSKHLLLECRWDGEEKYITQLNAKEAYTWSSVTLYNEPVMLKRETWFRNWLQQHRQPAADDIIQFHLSAGDGDTSNDLRMNRGGHTITVSVTCMELKENKSTMRYLDLQDNTSYTHELTFTKAAAVQ